MLLKDFFKRQAQTNEMNAFKNYIYSAKIIP